MQRTNLSNVSLTDFISTLREHPLRCVAPIVVMTVLSAAYAIVRQPQWQASQALIVRDEATGGLERPGKFAHVEDMKTVQETVLELAKSPAVLSAALCEVGPPVRHSPLLAWPTPEDIYRLQDALKISPPKGAEFGTTEVFYLHVSDSQRQRAVALAVAISAQVQSHFQKLREQKAQSMIQELTHTVGLAQADLDQSTRKLSDIERSVGRDLAELRILQESPSGDSQLRRTTIEMENELRQFRSAQQTNQELIILLSAAKGNTGRLLAAPNRLLESQPALRRLKEGLVDAQLRTAQLLGNLADAHPHVEAAKAAELEVARHLHSELETAISGVEVDQRITAGRIESLENEIAEANERMTRLAGLRAQYANLVSEGRHRTEILKTAEQELAEARASAAAASTASLISQVGRPDTGTGTAGPRRAMIVAYGLLGGVLVGLGIIFLTAQPAKSAAAELDADPFVPLAPTAGASAGTNGHSGLNFKQALRKLSNDRQMWN